MQEHISNVNVKRSYLNNNVKTLNVTPQNAQRIGRGLATMLDDDSSLAYYIKMAYYFPEYKLIAFADLAKRKSQTPAKYFTGICRNQINDQATS